MGFYKKMEFIIPKTVVKNSVYFPFLSVWSVTCCLYTMALP